MKKKSIAKVYDLKKTTAKFILALVCIDVVPMGFHSPYAHVPLSLNERL